MALKVADYIGIVEQLERDGNLTASAFRAVIKERTRGGRPVGTKNGMGGLNGRSSGAINDSLRRAVGIRAGWKCSYCLTDLADTGWANIHLDHATALVNGGTNDSRNLLLACGPCNGWKHDETISPEDFAARVCDKSRLNEALALIDHQRSTPITQGTALMTAGRNFEAARRESGAATPRQTIARAA